MLDSKNPVFFQLVLPIAFFRMFGFTFRQYAACPFRAHTASSVDEQVPGEARKKVPDNILLLRGQRISGIISPSNACLHALEGEMIPEICTK